jgi:Trypsin-like peptidase domain
MRTRIAAPAALAIAAAMLATAAAAGPTTTKQRIMAKSKEGQFERRLRHGELADGRLPSVIGMRRGLVSAPIGLVAAALAVGGASGAAPASVLPARLVASDPSSDIAVLDADAEASDVRRLTLGNSSRVEVGEGVVVIGSPFGLQNSVTAGIVSAVGRTISSPDSSSITDVIQTDAAVNRGNSGGPLLDMHGYVIGLVAQFQSASGGSSGVGLAVPSNTVKAVVDGLLRRRAHGKEEL